jgi:hypothetical protein
MGSLMSITPKEALEAIQVLWPGTTSLQKHALGWYAMEIRADGRYSAITYGSGVPIDWGDTDQYPLPEPEWVDAVMPDDWGKDARFGDDKKEWLPGMISGYSVLPDRSFCWWSGFSVYKFCQVRKVKT